MTIDTAIDDIATEKVKRPAKKRMSTSKSEGSKCETTNDPIDIEDH
jgi:hypothetical protein